MPDRQHPPPMPDPLSARLQRLEELLGFSEHAAEELAAGVADIGARLDRLTARVASLERTLARLSSPDEPAAPDDSAEQ